LLAVTCGVDSQLLVPWFTGGHYTTYALNYINLTWYEYDDQIVTEVDPQQVENCEAYVLFYRFLTQSVFSSSSRLYTLISRNSLVMDSNPSVGLCESLIASQRAASQRSPRFTYGHVQEEEEEEFYLPVTTTDSTNNRHSKIINGGLLESQSHWSLPPIVSTQMLRTN